MVPRRNDSSQPRWTSLEVVKFVGGLVAIGAVAVTVGLLPKCSDIQTIAMAAQERASTDRDIQHLREAVHTNQEAIKVNQQEIKELLKRGVP